MKRSSGVLLHITSLPSRFGVGSMGDEARLFIDFLSNARQSYWQVLPTGHTGYGDSPYQVFSAFAGNPYFIDLNDLAKRGWLTSQELLKHEQSFKRVDYGFLYENRYALLKKAYARAKTDDFMETVKAFLRKESAWANDYALFMAIKDANFGAAWFEWEDSLRLYDKTKTSALWERYYDDAMFYSFLQTVFFEQWESLAEYAALNNVKLLGDIPIYVAADSADVWASPELFELDDDRRLLRVAGVPPDYFSADGQLWGNPLYDWNKMQDDGFLWWKRRMIAANRMFDAVRIDHFRGFASYFSVAAGETTARLGRWERGPGMALINALKEACPSFEIIAEDLGVLTDDVVKLLHDSGLPGMRVLQFGLGGGVPNDHLIHNHVKNSVCYTATHDNNTTAGWFLMLSEPEKTAVERYFGIENNNPADACEAMILAGMKSVALLFIAPMQDWLALGEDSRMNLPGTAVGNWQWRMEQVSDALAARMSEITALTQRI